MPVLLIGGAVAVLVGLVVGRRSSAEGAGRLVAVLGAVAAVFGWAMLWLTVVGPGYVETTLTPGGETTRTRSLVDVGLSPLAIGAIVLEALGFFAVLLGGLAFSRSPRAGRWLMTAGLAPLIAIGSLSFGLAMVAPAIFVALLVGALAWSSPLHASVSR